MRAAWVALSFVVVTSFTAVAAADVPRGCKCGVASASSRGVLTAGMLGGGALLLLAARRRRR